MSYPVYEVPAGDVLPVLFATYAGSTGASVTMTGLAVTDIEIYKDGGTTQRASDAGYTLLDTDGTDFDGITGIHGFSIDTGDNTDAGFYTVGAWFHVVVSAVTVDSQTVNFIAAAFRIKPAESVAGKPKVDVDTFGGSAGTFASGRPEVNTTHAAGTAWGSGAITAASIAADAITAAKIADNAIDAGALAADCITAAKIAAGAIDAATFAADVDAEARSWLGLSAATLGAQLDNVENTVVTISNWDGSNFTMIPWNAAWDAEVQSEVQDAIEANHLDHLLAATYDPASKPGAADALLNELVENDGGVARYTANALEQAPAGGGGGGDATAANQTTIINHLTDIKGATFDTSTDSLEALRNRGDAAWITATGFATAASLATVAGYLDTEVAAILAAVDTEVGDIRTRVLLALPNAAAGAAGGLWVLGTNAPAATTLTGSAGNPALTLTGGSDSHGLSLAGTGTGSALSAAADAGTAVLVDSANARGLVVMGGAGSEAVVLGDADGSNDSGGVLIVAGIGSGDGLGIQANGDGSDALALSATGGGGRGILCTSADSDGAHFAGGGTGAGVEAVGGATGHGVLVTRGGTGADDLHLTNSDAPTLLAALGTGSAFTALATAADVTAILEDTGTTLPALLDALPTAAENATAVWANATRTLSAFGFTTFPTNFGSLAITAGGVVSADAKAVNGVTLTGTGVLGDEWGPA